MGRATRLRGCMATAKKMKGEKRAGHPVMRGLLAIKSGWLRFAAILAKVNTAILLTVIYFVAIMPANLIVRIGRIDLMGRRIGKERSFWQDPELQTMKIEDCRHQF